MKSFLYFILIADFVLPLLCIGMLIYAIIKKNKILIIISILLGIIAAIVINFSLNMPVIGVV